MDTSTNESSFTLNIDSYLDRIGFEGDLSPTYETLAKLIKCHVKTIPFENIDILLDRTIYLDIVDLEEKIIRKKRGGYCFELNTLFAALLEQVGFTFKRVGGRVIYRKDASTVRPRTHKILIVELNGDEWLVDVTFGAMGLTTPIKLNSKELTPAGNYKLRIKQTDSDEILQVMSLTEWINLYRFNRNEMQLIDYEVANFYTSKYPNSLFRKTLILPLTKSDFQYIVKGNEFITTDGKMDLTTKILSARELKGTLKNSFEMNLTLDDLSFFDPSDDSY